MKKTNREAGSKTIERLEDSDSSIEMSFVNLGGELIDKLLVREEMLSKERIHSLITRLLSAPHLQGTFVGLRTKDGEFYGNGTCIIRD